MEWIASEYPECKPVGDDAARTRRMSAPPLTREQVLRIAQPILLRKVKELCRDHCDNRNHGYNLRCTIDARWGSSVRNAPLCERENEAYDWIFRDLFGGEKAEKFTHSGAEGIEHFLAKTFSSSYFYERFKDMRYGGRVRVPMYIKTLHTLAHRVFWLLRKQRSVPFIAEHLQQPEAAIKEMVQAIQAALREHGSTQLLQPVVTVSFDALSEQSDTDWDIPGEQNIERDLEMDQEKQLVRAAYAKLTPLEQFLIEAMNNGLSAPAVLEALIQEGPIFDEITLVEPMDEKQRQQWVQRFHYLKRKAVERLQELFDKECRERVADTAPPGKRHEQTR